MTPAERARAAFKGLASGDAIGKQTETLSRDDVLRWYPGGVRGFEGRPGDTIPRYSGNRRREWRIGETTDDTEGTIAVLRAILRDPDISHVTVGEELLGCVKSVHPGVRSLWEFHQAGDPARIARGHEGCGAAIRVAPVGIFHPPERLDRIIAGAHQVAIPTHTGPLAIAAAAATAAAVSAAVEGWSRERVADFAVRAAREAEWRWSASGEAAISEAIERIHDDLSTQRFGRFHRRRDPGRAAPGDGERGVVPGRRGGQSSRSAFVSRPAGAAPWRRGWSPSPARVGSIPLPFAAAAPALSSPSSTT